MSVLQLDVQLAKDVVALPENLDFATWANAAMLPDATRAEVVLRVVGAEEGIALNQRYRQRKGATNVLSFAYEPIPGWPDDQAQPLGDLVLCAPVISGEAVAQKKSITAHYAHMCVHGMLHLQGHDHQHPSDASIMEALERDILAKLGFPNPYQETR